jgi:hypothetical protein
MRIIGWTIAAICVVASMCSANAEQDKKEEPRLIVRPLKFAAKDAAIMFKIGAQNKVVVLGDAEAVEKLVGKASAKGLLDGVDFAKDKIVLVSWSSGGPPDGVLKHETKGDMVQFYVQGPPAGKARGERLRVGADFFAVPRDLKVSFDPKER